MTYRIGPCEDFDYPGLLRTLARFLFAALERMSSFAIARAVDRRARDVSFPKEQ